MLCLPDNRFPPVETPHSLRRTGPTHFLIAVLARNETEPGAEVLVRGVQTVHHACSPTHRIYRGALLKIRRIVMKRIFLVVAVLFLSASAALATATTQKWTAGWSNFDEQIGRASCRERV